MPSLQFSTADLAPGRPYVERDEREPPWHDRSALWLWHGVMAVSYTHLTLPTKA